MFSLPGQTNPLELLVAHTGNDLVQQQIANKEKVRKEQELTRAFSKLNDRSSPLDIMQTLQSLDIPTEEKKLLFQGFDSMEKAKQQKQAAESKAQSESLRSNKLAKSYGLAPEETEGLTPAEISTLAKYKQGKSAPGGLGGQPVPQEIQDKIAQVVENNPKASPDEIQLKFGQAGIPQGYTKDYIENRRAQETLNLKRETFEHRKQAHETEFEYKERKEARDAQKKIVDDITNQYESYVGETKPKVMQLNALNEDEDIMGPTTALFMERMGFPLGLTENPSNELYQKVSQDLLKGIQDIYGARILDSEVQNFLKTIPTLLNSANGRRMIASNILKIGEMKKVLYEDMRAIQKESFEEGKPLPDDFRQRIFDNALPQMERIGSEFAKMSTIKDIPKGKVPYFDNQGNIKFIDKTPEAMKWADENGGKRIW